ncbi:acetyl-CoA carboxylase biotin carboxyl carrier protein [Geobacillus sp. FSL K6-0789]|uniref:Biotin carboxyl carrier protein of acetyl-CoA carboxylase n=1 Tax=Geobacillus stearothermophilus TaxID=1422 RepID=A0A0K9HR51_GEOSE|nr:acetyl-CoA carboxylase biotin carboxyl carrier protein [Geobacillus stearothermophilus]KAF6509948.1 Biotin carboxyl carrier protein of acetyl-CoA carboxylase [Geobacillus stearothermophilus]KMY61370.1 acetyl-CoA carboxylase [Geobacillus stearothermophilus]KMY62191.1 acetyl-CoA carboxylase [Geobacillus stearothermophilus]KMY63663.1 acetyl-CoA carboxylase [Geobacillus stearothermophilus]MED3664241.1 acetyl-CoA carboxylase biotin carboxyl carrier protein [Geobacillus stearothermophilus]
MKIQEIRELIRLVDQSSIDEFVYEQGETKVHMKKAVAVAVAPAAAPAAPAQAVAAVEPTAAPALAPVQVAASEVKQAPETEPTAAKEAKPAVEGNLHQITSPMVGTFYAAPAPDKPPYVKPGDKVKKDTVVCIIEAMKLFNEIEAEVDGEIVEVLVQNGQLVEYGQPLFLVKPD